MTRCNRRAAVDRERPRLRLAGGAVAVYGRGALRDNGIEIPFPQRDLHLRSVADDVKGLGEF